LGIEYSQVANLLIKATEEGYLLTNPEGILELTQLGKDKLEELNNKIDNKILPENESRIPKIDKFDVYLPKKKNINY
jgi:hypothetical protein